VAKIDARRHGATNPGRSAVAIPVNETAALVTMRFGPRGPWSIVTDMSADGRELNGPPPGYLALAGWGC
jgi:hypothetical protein